MERDYQRFLADERKYYGPLSLSEEVHGLGSIPPQKPPISHSLANLLLKKPIENPKP